MRSMMIAAAAAVSVVLLASTAPVLAQAPDPSQMLQGLLSGNRGQDQAVRDAFERGYRRGREDQERADRDRGPPRGHYPDDNRGYPPPPGQGPYGR